jgi:SAM-dependent methyltransferase
LPGDSGECRRIIELLPAMSTAANLVEPAAQPTPPTTQEYYDRFAENYEAERHHGYHRLIDELELGLIRRFGAGKDVFEAGCGTGLLLREAARVARSAWGLDLSRGMLTPARARGLHVLQGSLTHVPLPSASFDLVYSMKVLAHIPPIEHAVAELARLVRPGGHLLLEFYNPLSLRYLAKRLGGPGKIAHATTESDVFTRFDTLERARSYLPADVELVGVRGVRVLTPTSAVFAVPPLGRLFTWAERLACDLPVIRNLGGFLILVARKRGA